tara:strand:+ start:1484 stop:1738 length:255 start_codon:yes stop_codon:yes gene_type:complete
MQEIELSMFPSFCSSATSRSLTINGLPEWLYVQTAATAQMTSDTTLKIPFTRDVFGFTDRLYRKQAYLTAFEFASLWTSVGDST